jgi:flavodoxin short chain
MKSIAVIYWSGTGNTEMMAKAIAEGAAAADVEVSLMTVSDAKVSDALSADAVALGCPSMGAEVLEEDEMEPFVAALNSAEMNNKPVALFGSYDWGNGEWMKDWENRMKGYGATLIQEGLIVNLTPDAEALKECKELGSKLAGSL